MQVAKRVLLLYNWLALYIHLAGAHVYRVKFMWRVWGERASSGPPEASNWSRRKHYISAPICPLFQILFVFTNETMSLRRNCVILGALHYTPLCSILKLSSHSLHILQFANLSFLHFKFQFKSQFQLVSFINNLFFTH